MTIGAGSVVTKNIPNVVFPDPEGPTKAVIVPSFALKLTLSN